MSTRAQRKQKIEEVAQRLGVSPVWLDALINFETAGTYSPTVKNPTSSARGLIQVIDSTAQSDFGVSDSLELVNQYPTFESQMENVVYPYLEKYMPFSGKQSLYMAVFYPAYRNVPAHKAFPEHVRAANPGIDSPRDYIDFVERRINRAALHFPMGTKFGAAVLIAGAALWLLYKKVA